MTKARPLIPPQRRYTAKGNLMEISAWEVPVSQISPEGVTYSFQLISNDQRVLGFDNNTGEGHHRHFMRAGKLVKEHIKFTNFQDIFKRFVEAVDKYEKEYDP